MVDVHLLTASHSTPFSFSLLHVTMNSGRRLKIGFSQVMRECWTLQEQPLALSFTNYQHIHSFALWTNATITPLNKKAITNGQGDIQKPLYSLFALTIHLGGRLLSSLPKTWTVARVTTAAFPMRKPLRAWAPPSAHTCKIRSLPP